MKNLTKKKPIIRTADGVVPEHLRHQAAINMKLDPIKRQAVEQRLIEELGQENGLKECRLRYFEAYEGNIQ